MYNSQVWKLFRESYMVIWQHRKFNSFWYRLCRFHPTLVCWRSSLNRFPPFQLVWSLFGGIQKLDKFWFQGILEAFIFSVLLTCRISRTTIVTSLIVSYRRFTQTGCAVYSLFLIQTCYSPVVIVVKIRCTIVRLMKEKVRLTRLKF